MIKELVDFGGRKRKEIYLEHNYDSLTQEDIESYIVIDKEGYFIDLIPLSEKRTSIVEDVIRTEDAGRTSGILPRLVVDNAQYVLGHPKDKPRSKKCLDAYLGKMERYRKIKGIDTILKFYAEKKELAKAYAKYDEMLGRKELSKGNIAFLIKNKTSPVHEDDALYNSIETNYQDDEKSRNNGRIDVCSVCGKSTYRSFNVATHGAISSVPDGQSSGCYLVAYNAEAFTSYGLNGNDNAALCTHCVKNYVEGLNWLMTNGRSITTEKKERFVHSNRKKIADDTAVVFWTRENITPDEINLLETPIVEDVKKVIESVYSGKEAVIDSNAFYAVSLSGAAARIAVRDWIETSVSEVKKNIAQWFTDIGIIRDGDIHYPPLYFLATTCKNRKESNDRITGRVGTILWRSAIKNHSLPAWILSAVLNRVRAEMASEDHKKSITGSLSPPRAALIKLFLNRNPDRGGICYMEKLDEKNKGTAYVCGRLFAVLESIQWFALGDTNAGIRERYFSSASTTPGLAFGRLMKLSQHHLSKLKGEKPGLAVNLDKDLQELCASIEGSQFPATFRLEEQGAFALGYYHQKNKKYNE